MPNEMKGDRSYHEALRRLGIKNPGEINVQNPVVLTAAVDDLTKLSRPLGNMYGLALFRAGAPGERAGGWITAGAGGLTILGIRWEGASRIWTIDGAVPAIGTQAANPCGMYFGEASAANQRAITRNGTDASAVWATVAFPYIIGGSTSMDNVATDWYLPPGRTLIMKRATDNTSMSCSVIFTEVQIGA